MVGRLGAAKTIATARMDKSVVGAGARRIMAAVAVYRNVAKTMAIANKVKSVATVAASTKILVRTVRTMPIAVTAYNVEMVAVYRNPHLVAVEKRRTVTLVRFARVVDVATEVVRVSDAGMTVSAVMA